MSAEIQQPYRELEQIVVRSVLHEMQAGLKKLYGKDHPLILVYGSYARGEADVESDIDVLLIYSGEIKPGREIRRVGSMYNCF